MTFTRTKSGLDNLRLFYRVDLYVFTEGSTLQTRQNDSAHGLAQSANLDIKFWQTIFDIYKPSRTCHFRSVGGKLVLLEIARAIQDHKLQHVVVCMDRDHDARTGKLIQATNVVYTRGYSWENDVWKIDVMRSVHDSLCTAASARQSHKRALSDSMRKFSIRLRRPVELEVRCAVACDFLPLSEVRAQTVVRYRSALPAVTIKPFLVKLNEDPVKKNACRSVTLQSAVKTLDECNGHLLADYCYELMRKLLESRCGLPSFPKVVFGAFAIFHCQTALRKGGVLSRHYVRELNRVV